MKSIIEEIYYGNRGRHDSIKPSKEYMQICNKLCVSHENFCKKLPENLKEDFDEVCRYFDEREAKGVIESYK